MYNNLVLFFKQLLLALEKLSNLFSSIASIAGLLSVYLAYKTLKEMSHQRRTTYFPDLSLKNSNINIYLKTDDTFRFFEFYDLEGLEPKVIGNNIGLGIAKHIEVFVGFNQRDVFETIKNLDDQDFLKFNYLTIEYNNSQQNLECSFNTAYLESINHVIPNSDFYFDAPTDYCCLYSIFLSSLYKKNQWSDRMINRFPPLYVSLKYQDIEGNKFEKTFKGILKFEMFEPKFDNDGLIGRFEISLQETNIKQ